MLSHPAFSIIAPLHAYVQRHDDHAERIAALNNEAGDAQLTLKFIPAPPQKISAVDYETRLVTHGEVIVSDGWHDLFNAYIWLTFPKTKAVISKLHVELGAGAENRRPRRRDVLTLFDEAGLIILSERNDLRLMNEQHQWKTLFVEHRTDFIRDTKLMLFGHGAMEQLLTKPHRGLTVKALWLPLPASTPVNEVDDFLSLQIAANRLLTDDERRTPLPLLGIPGWFAENDDPRCYDDISVFRPRRAGG